MLSYWLMILVLALNVMLFEVLNKNESMPHNRTFSLNCNRVSLHLSIKVNLSDEGDPFVFTSTATEKFFICMNDSRV